MSGLGPNISSFLINHLEREEERGREDREGDIDLFHSTAKDFS